MAYQRKTQKQQKQKQQKRQRKTQRKIGGYVWDTKIKKHKLSTIKSKSAVKKPKSAYSILPNVIN